MKASTILPFVLLFLLTCAPLQADAAPGGPADEACYSDPATDACAAPAPPILVTQAEGLTVAADAGTADAPEGNGQWRWRRGTGRDLAITLGAIGSAIYLETIDPKTPKWSGRNDFDEGVRNALRVDGDRDDRRFFYHASDVLMGIMIAAPEVDAMATLGYRDRNWDALYETLMMDVESFTFTSFVSVLLQTQIARERPFVRNCRDGGHCESDQENRSFPSGHAAYAFTGAGLLCTHHQYQHTYGNRETEDAVCATALGVASADGLMRIMADGHYATDILAGTAIGLFSGFLLPRILHYWHPVADTAPKGAKRETGFVVAPAILPGNGAGLSCRYYF